MFERLVFTFILYRIAGSVTTASEKLPDSAYVPVNVGLIPPWDHVPLAAESLQYFAEMGDVQTAVSLLLVLGNKVNKIIPEYVQVRLIFYTSRSKCNLSRVIFLQEQWCNEYMELLQRHKLWNVSNMVVRMASNIPHINTLNQNSTVIQTVCAR